MAGGIGLGLSLGGAAMGGVDGLREVLRRQFLQSVEQRIAEDEDANRAQNQGQFDAMMPLRERGMAVDERGVAVNEKNVGLRADELGLVKLDRDALDRVIGSLPASQQTPANLMRFDIDPTKIVPAGPEIPNTDYARYLHRFAKSKGLTFDTLTPEQELQARQGFGQSDDRAPRTTLSPGQEVGTVMRLQKDWDTLSKDARDMRAASNRMVAAWDALESDPAMVAPAAEAVQVMFQKILDPGSVVREGEFMRSKLTQPVVNRIRGALDRLVSGGTGIPIPELQQYVNLAAELADATEADLKPQRGRFESTATSYGIDPSLIFGTEAPRRIPKSKQKTPGGGTVPPAAASLGITRPGGG